jgi:phosphohistidine swiveling domain-containing protein
MKLEKVLEKLDGLLEGWGIKEADWFLGAEYAWKLQGYDLILRKGHLDIYINRKKWPWKTEPKDISCLPPPKSKEFQELKKFMKETKFAPHFIPCPMKMEYHPLDELRKNSKLYPLPNGKKIRIYKISADFQDRLNTLLKENLSTWKRETVERWFKYFPGIKEIAKKKKDKVMLEICKTALKRLESVQKEFKLLKEKIPSRVSEIKGVCACGGRVIGKVQVILTHKDLSKFKKGNILVTSMTTPEFVSIVEKAKAIVTDDGGMGCHAAVISREFKIPCIIGTKIATKAIKDGDLIEVDASGTKGIVKILKRAKKMSKQKIILKGIPASPGIVRGKVRLILDPSECSKMKRGEILVTEMTNLLFMPTVKK